MDLSKIIKYFQCHKNLDDIDIYRNENYKCNYLKFLKGINHIPENIFLMCLDNLHINLEDIYELLDTPSSEKIYYEILEAKMNNKQRVLKKLRNKCDKYKTMHVNDSFQHLQDIIDLWLLDIHQDYDKYCLINYLKDIKFWTKYEYRMLNAIILTLPFDLATQFYEKAKVKNTKKIINNKNLQESLWLDLNYLLLCLKNQKWRTSELLISRLNNRLKSEYMLTERVIFMLLKDLYQILKFPDKVESHENFKNDLFLLKRLDCDRLMSGSIKLLVELMKTQNNNKINIDIDKIFPF